jgi:diacylglycerol kinase
VARSFRFAWQGVRDLNGTQPNWRIHLFAGALACALGIGLRVPPAELALLALTIGLVLALEAMNTAIEAAVDTTGLPPSPSARRAKDSAAAGVLLGAIAAVAVGALVLGPRVLSIIVGAS